MKPRRTLSELRFRDDAGEFVERHSGLVFFAIGQYWPSLLRIGGDMLDSVVSVCRSTGLCGAHRDYDPAKGAESTLAMTYLRNLILKERKKYCRDRRRVKSFVLVRHDSADIREMQPDVAAVTDETIRRNTTGDLFS